MSRPRRRGWIAAAVAMALLLAGCQRTLFSQAPGGEPGCDPVLAGQWHSLGDGDVRDGEVEATLSPDCTLRLVEHRAQGARNYPPLLLNTTTIGGRQLLWVDATGANAALEIVAGPVDRAGSVYLFAWSVDGDVATVLPPDHRRIAGRVIDGALPGAVYAEDHALTVRLDTTTPEALAAIVAAAGSMDADKALRLRRAAPVPAQ